MKKGLVAALALAVLAGCATVPFTGRRQLSLVSQAELAAMAAQDYDAFLSGVEVSGDARARATVVSVGERVARSAESFMRAHGMEHELGHYDWEFELIEDNETANAFCMPGGKIAVYTGIMPVAQDEEGLAVVVAHEVAHAVANHGGERMSQLLLANLGGMALSRAIEKEPEETRQLAMVAYGIGANVAVLLPYSRQHESEADRIGLTLMARAGYDPREAVPFWERMSREGGPAPPEFLSTHPSHETRIDDIRSYLPEALEEYGQQ